MLRKALVLLLVPALLSVAVISLVHAEGTVIHVTSTDPGTGGPDCRLRDAISAANNGSVAGGCNGAGVPPFLIVLQADALYTLKYLDNNSSSEGPNGLPLITGNINIEGHGATLERSFKFNEKEIPFRFFQVQKEGVLKLRDLTLRQGQGYVGGAMYNKGYVTAKNVQFFSNNGSCGGAIYNGDKASLRVTGSIFSHNDAHG